jgi:GNAT superfamily N-acetyltransferase
MPTQMIETTAPSTRDNHPVAVLAPPADAAGPAGLRIRPLTHADGALIDAVSEALSARSRFLRFHAPTPHLTPSLRALLLDLDGRDRAALVAEIPTAHGWRPIGIARLARVAPGEAEIAIVVTDDCQHHGVGRRLLRALGGLASQLGYRELRGIVLLENDGVVRLLRRVFPGTSIGWEDDLFLLRSPLTAADASGLDAGTRQIA